MPDPYVKRAKDIWRKPWYRGLSREERIVWDYLTTFPGENEVGIIESTVSDMAHEAMVKPAQFEKALARFVSEERVLREGETFFFICRWFWTQIKPRDERKRVSTQDNNVKHALKELRKLEGKCPLLLASWLAYYEALVPEITRAYENLCKGLPLNDTSPCTYQNQNQNQNQDLNHAPASGDALFGESAKAGEPEPQQPKPAEKQPREPKPFDPAGHAWKTLQAQLIASKSIAAPADGNDRDAFSLGAGGERSGQQLADLLKALAWLKDAQDFDAIRLRKAMADPRRWTKGDIWADLVTCYLALQVGIDVVQQPAEVHPVLLPIEPPRRNPGAISMKEAMAQQQEAQP